MPAASGENYEKSLASLRQEADSILDQFLSRAESGAGFYASIQSIEALLSRAERLHKAETDLELNEAVVLSDKLEGQISSASPLADGAAISESQEAWADKFESLQLSLDRLASHAHKAADGQRGAAASFAAEALSAKKKLFSLSAILNSRSHSSHRRLSMARARLSKLRAGVGRANERLSRTRLRKSVGEMREGLLNFMRKTGKGRIFIDHKHLTLGQGSGRMQAPLTSALRFSLEELAPIGDSLSRLGRGALVTGRYEKEGNEIRLFIGERTVKGDAVHYTERSYTLQ